MFKQNLADPKRNSIFGRNLDHFARARIGNGARCAAPPRKDSEAAQLDTVIARQRIAHSGKNEVDNTLNILL